MAVTPVFYAKPAAERLALRLQPRLASWNVAGDPDQRRLTAALEDASTLLVPAMASVGDPIALRLDVGLPATVPLLVERDLDNYAFPLASHLAKTTNRRIASVWCTKQHEAASFVRVETALLLAEEGGSQVHFDVRTGTSAATTAYKQQIHDQLGDVQPLPEGSVSLEVAFAVGPRRCPTAPTRQRRRQPHRAATLRRRGANPPLHDCTVSARASVRCRRRPRGARW